MSYTEIHFLDKDSSKSFQVGEVQNAWRGAMYVWNHIAAKYFGLSSFPMFDDEMRMKVWNADDHVDVEEHDLFVLLSTMDNATINAKDKEYAIEMMRKFQEENPDSSIGEQADLIEACDSLDGCFAFCQTNIVDFWGLSFDDELEKYVYIDLDGDTKYFCTVGRTRHKKEKYEVKVFDKESESRMNKQERLEEANKLIKSIANHGRKFFSEGYGYAELLILSRERVFFIDAKTCETINTHNHKWVGFSHGGTLRVLIEYLRDYINEDEKFSIDCICTLRRDGSNVWGYDRLEAKKLINEVKGLDMFNIPTAESMN